MAITTTLSPYTGDLPLYGVQAQAVFVARAEYSWTWMATSIVTQINEVIIQANALETNINAKEVTASEAAVTATTQAGIATTQAGLADTSRIAAQAAQTAAEGALDAFDDRYLGSKATAPTLDNDGNALLSGALYWNSVSNQMFIRDTTLNQWISLSFIPTSHTSLSNLGNDDHPQYLLKAGGALTGAVNITEVDKGTVSTGTVTFTQSAGQVQRLQVGGALTIAVSGWGTSGLFSDLLIKLVNGGSATVTLPTINWIKPDGTVTTTFATYLTAISRPALQTSGTDFMYLFTDDTGTTIYGKLI